MSIDVSCKLHKRQGGEKMTITMSGKTIGENIKLARMQAGISRLSSPRNILCFGGHGVQV